MKKAELVMKKLWLKKIKFTSREYLKKTCRDFGINYENMVHYLLERKYLLRIFRGIFYVKSLEEIRFKRVDVDTMRLVANGLEIKGVKKWYFGLYTALKMNNLTHEFFGSEHVINDKVLRPKGVKINDRKFVFVKVKPSLIFGIIEKNGLKYSDAEKTVLDFIYLWRYRGIPKEKIISDVSDWAKNISRKKLKDYSKAYPKTVRNIVEELR